MEYETQISAANSLAHKNGVPLDVAMLWARQNIVEGSITIIGRGKEKTAQIQLLEANYANV